MFRVAFIIVCLLPASCVTRSESVEDFARASSHGMLNASLRNLKTISLFSDNLLLSLPSHQEIQITESENHVDFHADIGLRTYLSCSAYQLNGQPAVILPEVYRLWYQRIDDLKKKPELSVEMVDNKPILYFASSFENQARSQVNFKNGFIHFPNFLLACAHNGLHLDFTRFQALMRSIASQSRDRSPSNLKSKTRIVSRQNQIGFQTVGLKRLADSNRRWQISLVLNNSNLNELQIKSRYHVR